MHAEICSIFDTPDSNHFPLNDRFVRANKAINIGIGLKRPYRQIFFLVIDNGNQTHWTYDKCAPIPFAISVCLVYSALLQFLRASQLSFGLHIYQTMKLDAHVNCQADRNCLIKFHIFYAEKSHIQQSELKFVGWIDAPSFVIVG